jgi:NAD(P)-dependent dehydrogenase (short-subunit alcohol dehydrogenase family)
MITPVVLITGALTGIGRATAIAFAKEGARLVVSGRKEAEGKALEAELRRLGAETEFVVADVRHEKDVSNLVDGAVAQFGRLDVAINNAGTEGRPGPLTDVSIEMYSAMFDSNAASKHAVEGMTESAALERRVGRSRQCRGARPDRVRDARPLHRHGRTQGNPGGGACRSDGSVSPTRSRRIISLASDAASFVTGQIITADGGKTAG